MRFLSALFVGLLFSSSASAATFYLDNDGDGYGQDAVKYEDTATGATPRAGYVADGGDCNDTDAAINPDATEGWGQAGDGVDQDCDGADKALPSVPADVAKKFKKNYPTMTTLALSRTYGYCGETAGCTIDNAEGKFTVTATGKALCDMTVTKGYWRLWDADQCDQTAGLMSRGGGGVSKTTVEKMVTEGAAAAVKPITERIDTLAEEWDNAFGSMDERVYVLERDLDTLNESIAKLDQDMNTMYDMQVYMTGGVTTKGTKVKTEDSTIGRINAALDSGNETDRAQNTSINNLSSEVENNGLMILGSIGGELGYQRPYAVREGGKFVRDAFAGGAGVGGFFGGRFGNVQLGASGNGTRIWDPSYGNAMLLGLEGTYFFGDFGFGLFLGGGSHESSGKPPVESAVIGRYGLVGLQGVYNAPIEGNFMLQIVPRLSGGVEAFGTKASDGSQTVVDVQPGALIQFGVEIRAGMGPKGI
jgi:hypothetical protein